MELVLAFDPDRLVENGCARAHPIADLTLFTRGELHRRRRFDGIDQ